MTTLPDLIFRAQALIHQIVDDTHLMFQISASDDGKKETFQNSHTVYSSHMKELRDLIIEINEEMVMNFIIFQF